MSQNKRLSSFIEAALIAALAMALSLIPDFASWFSPSFGAIPLVLFSIRRVLKFGLLAALIWGLLHFILGKVYYLTLSQVVIEYILAFLMMGLAGVFTKPYQSALKVNHKKAACFWITLASILAVSLRYFWHYIAGVIFWGSYAPKGMSPYLYSLSVNGIAGLFTLILLLIVSIIVTLKFPKVVLP